jgi:hypothetical protein
MDGPEKVPEDDPHAASSLCHEWLLTDIQARSGGVRYSAPCPAARQRYFKEAVDFCVVLCRRRMLDGTLRKVIVQDVFQIAAVHCDMAFGVGP